MMVLVKNKAAFLFLTLLFLGKGLLAQTHLPEKQTPFVFGQVHTLQSKVLGEERVLNIRFPSEYFNSTDSLNPFPVLYVLDGSAHEDFPHVARLVQFCNMYQMYPPSIVVGIANVDRYRDFTTLSDDPEDMKGIPNAGGAGKFMDFLEKEVIPFVNEHYPCSGQRTLIGQSLGGLLATQVLLERPHLFEDYILVSPSLWWNKKKLVNEAAGILKEKQELQKRIFLSLGEEHPVMHEVADQLAEAIRESGNEKLQFRYEPILDEDHATILHSAAYRALKWLGGAEKQD